MTAQPDGFRIKAQPTETSCGPTCLHAVYQYYNDNLPLDAVIQEIPQLTDGGTLAVHLGNHALKKGYRAELYTYNLRVFDPSWFNPSFENSDGRLERQIAETTDSRRQHASAAYLEFHQLGGSIHLQDLTGSLIRRILRQQQPILTGLSSTFLYRSKREIPETCEESDIQGEPTGHFVVICGYDPKTKEVLVADPYELNPIGESTQYHVPMDRLINSILLGVLTYDANLLVIKPRS